MKTPLLLCLLLLSLTAHAGQTPITSTPPVASQPVHSPPCSQEYTDLSTAYGQLLSFRDDPLFIRHGFTANSPHADWLDHVRDLGRKPGYSQQGPRLLAMLAVAIRQHGATSDVSRDFTSQLERELRRLRDSRVRPTPAPTPAPGVTPPISILYTGDTQGVLLPQPVHDSSVGGLARRMSLLDKLRTESPDMILLDAGDAFTSTSQQAGRNNAIMVEAMNRMGYDAMGLGLHDLTMGAAHLRDLVDRAKFPVICTNLNFSGGENWIKSHALITRDDTTLAVLGLTPNPSRSPIPGARFVSPKEALSRFVPELKARDRLIVVLSQLPQAETEAALNGIDDVDVVIADARGHATTTTPRIFPAMAKGLGVGQIDLEAENGTPTAQAMHLLDEAVADAGVNETLDAWK